MGDESRSLDHCHMSQSESQLSVLHCYRSKIRAIPGVPLLYLHGNCPTLEKPSGLTTKSVEKSSEERLLTSHQEKTIKRLKKEVFGEPEPTEPKSKKKRKGPKGPNPLSCKKKQKKPSDNLRGVKDKLEGEGKKKKKKKKRKTVVET